MISLDSDVLGLGSMTDKSSTMVQGCGARPNCIGGDHCEKSKDAFDDCVRRQQEINAMNAQASLQLQNKAIGSQISAQNKKFIYIIVGIIALIVIVKILK